MAFDRFLIGFNDGNSSLQTDVRPWLIADNAFASLRNAYVFRGRVRKRFGERLMGTTQLQSRLRIGLTGAGVGVTDGAGNATGTAPGHAPNWKIGQAFTIGATIFTVWQANGAMLTTGPGTGTFNTATGAYTFAGATALTQIFFYPAEPVIGLTTFEAENHPINNEPAYGFDTQFVYKFTAGVGWDRSQTAGVPLLHGNDLNFVWTTNWRGVATNIDNLFISNFFVVNPNGAGNASDDPIWTFDGTTWTQFSPIFLTSGATIKTARIILPFKDRLILLNTIENTQADGLGTNSTHTNRCRYSHNGSPFSTNAWLEPNQVIGGTNADGAGFVDATTSEEIVSAEFIKDRLIVYFERSTWELVYTGNQVLPFVWQKINTELGAESTFSVVPFDKVVLGIGNTGVHACTGANVERIDSKIPEKIFQIKNKDEGVKRVAGIREYITEMVYWTFPASDETVTTPSGNEKYPNRVLIYNYKTGAWAFNDDCITAFGYFEQQLDNSSTWAQAPGTWQQANFTWNSGIEQAQARQVIAGNQEGFTFIIDSDVGRNAPVMQITNITTAPATTLTIVDHTLAEGEYIAIEGALGVVGLNNNIFFVNSIIDKDTITLFPAPFTGTYLGGGYATRVSNLGILSKQWNPYVDQDRNVYIHRIDFGVQTTQDGEVTVDYFPSSTELSMVTEGQATGAIMGNNVLETSPYLLVPLEQQQTRVWHPIYLQSDGECIQIFIYMSDHQITNKAIAWSDFELEGMILFTKSTSYRLQ